MPDSDRRQLTDEEIAELKKNGCIYGNPESVIVNSDFDASCLFNVMLDGKISIGRQLCGSGPSLRNVALSNVNIGDDCVISNVRGRIANADIEANVVIEDVGTIECTGKTSFGNGLEVSALNEGGGREFLMTESSSAQEAYLSILHRGNMNLCDRLKQMEADFAQSRRSDRLRIGRAARIKHVKQILNVNIGESAEIHGASSLIEGTVCSSLESPAVVGNDVIAREFIIGRGAIVTDGAMVNKSLIGEGARIGKQFSSEESLMFANCEGFHSEVCSLFAGPYSVTHHRSTLLIAVMTSFYNAGSATNQSNHMYKLGPVHQGIMERGCKTGSASYLLWPSRVGAFTAVMGKHYANFDTADFPFSYIDEDGGKSMLIPGMNLFTVGTLRDSDKWPQRDRRKHKDKNDAIIFDVLSPYTIAKALRAIAILTKLHDETDKKHEYVKYNGINIKRLLLRTCSRYYRMAVEMYLGSTILAWLQENSLEHFERELSEASLPAEGVEDWVDMCGLLCRQSRLDELIESIVSEEIKSLQELRGSIQFIKDKYETDSRQWALCAYRQFFGKDLRDDIRNNIIELSNSWKKSSNKFFNMIKGDAGKEFETVSMTGFGVDGDPAADFKAVRGTLEENSFIKSLETRILEVEQTHKRVENIVAGK